MTVEEKVRENRLRRAVARRGWQLRKIRCTDPRATDYGKYLLTPPPGTQHGLRDLRMVLQPQTIEQVEAWLER